MEDTFAMIILYFTLLALYKVVLSDDYVIPDYLSALSGPIPDTISER